MPNANLRVAYERFGEIVDVQPHGTDEAVISFTSKEAAVKAINFDPKALGLGSDAFICHDYNDRPYDDRGWCTFEEAVTIEFIGRSRKPGNDEMRAVMDSSSRPKILQISTLADPQPVEPTGPQDQATVLKKLGRATFIGAGDYKLVRSMYKRFQLDGANAASKLGDKMAKRSNVKARQQLAIENVQKRLAQARERPTVTTGAM